MIEVQVFCLISDEPAFWAFFKVDLQYKSIIQSILISNLIKFNVTCDIKLLFLIFWYFIANIDWYN